MIKLFKFKLTVLMLIVFVFNNTTFLYSQEEEMPLIDDVVIEGNSYVNTSLIKKQLRTRPGNKFNRIDINNDIKALYQMGSFTNIDVDIVEKDKDGKFKVIFIISEKQKINEVKFKGNKKISKRTLKKKIESDDLKLLNEKSIAKDVTEIKKAYEEKGYMQIEVNEEIVKNDEGTLDIVFNIKEGKKVKIKKINIIGTKGVKEKKVLKILKTKKKGILGLFRSGKYKDEEFVEDLERIKAFYYQEGYIDIKVENVEKTLVEDNKRLIIDITINEGLLYKVNSIDVEGNKNYKKEELIGKTALKPGETFLPKNLQKDLKQVKDVYLKNGYIDVAVNYSTLSENDPQLLNIVFNVKENEIAFVNQVKVLGNQKTKDIVIRRELNVNPGDKYDGVKMEVAQKRLANLGLFKSVDVYADPTTKDPSRDLFIEVEEDRTGELGFGAGYSSVDNLIGFIELSQGNFDIFNFPSFTGDGQKLQLRSEFGSRKEEFSINFTEPWLFNRRLLFGTQLFTRTREYTNSDFTEDRKGVSFRLAKPVFKYTRAELRYSFENVEILNVDDTASEYLRAQEGERDVGKIGLKFTRDVRDSFFNATQGSKLTWDMEVAGIGGDIEYYKSLVSSDLYFNPLFDNVLIASLKIGGMKEYGASEDVPIFDRFFLGGAWSVRGFEYRDLGPHDELGEPLGGKFMYYGTFEYLIPIIEQFKFATFYDFGNLYVSYQDTDFGEINTSFGMGLRILLDARIPLRFDYAWPMTTDEYHEGDGGEFTFDIGQRF
ncbi:MAG: hypothetical protein ACD_79C00249G0011 [uncultured bacterium]|nr:MAG: hypothetical protein ACD_79C00249G0011 [uncultured bacterium]